MWNSESVCVVFPAYNEEPNIEAAVREFLDLRSADGSALVDEVLVVDNNSSDRTGELARAAGARVVLETKQGYGNALQRGLREANKTITVLCEPDGTFAAADIIKLLAWAGDLDMVLGTRTHASLLRKGANMGWFLRWGNIAVAKIMQILYAMPSLTDCGCTFRLIRTSRAKDILGDLTVGQSHFLPNMVIAARLRGLRFAEVPLTYGQRIGTSKITGSFSGTWKTGMNMIRIILAMWPRFLLSK
jgi:glycosyltransferase involved in cell wall biosynthesis